MPSPLMYFKKPIITCLSIEWKTYAFPSAPHSSKASTKPLFILLLSSDYFEQMRSFSRISTRTRQTQDIPAVIAITAAND
jgi:hypothetical protein